MKGQKVSVTACYSHFVVCVGPGLFSHLFVWPVQVSVHTWMMSTNGLELKIQSSWSPPPETQAPDSKCLPRSGPFLWRLAQLGQQIDLGPTIMIYHSLLFSKSYFYILPLYCLPTRICSHSILYMSSPLHASKSFSPQISDFEHPALLHAHKGLVFVECFFRSFMF